MRHLLILSATIIVCALPVTTRAADGNTSVQGFGGLTFGTSAIAGTSTAPTFGGGVSIAILPNLQIVGEAGRLTDVKPPLLDLLDFTPFGLRVSAWYGEGGVRFVASPSSAVRPYVEATAGMARMSTGVGGFGGRTGAVVDAGLAFLNRTEPMLGAGGGVVLQGGPLSVDIGYRYKKIMAGGIASVLNGRNDYQVNQVRIGVGVRF